MKPTKTWVVIADGDQAKIFEHDGPGKGLHIVDGLKLEQAHLKSGDIMADRPGRASNPSSPGSRAAVDYRTDPAQERERRFVEHLADLLDQKHSEGAFERLYGNLREPTSPESLGLRRHAARTPNQSV